MLNCSHSQPASINLGYTLDWGKKKKEKSFIFWMAVHEKRTYFKERLHVWDDSEALPSFNERGVEQPQRTGKKLSKTTTVWLKPHWFSLFKKSEWCCNQEHRPLTTRRWHKQFWSLQKDHLFRIIAPYMHRGLWTCWMQLLALRIQTLPFHLFLWATWTVTDPVES